MDDLTKAANEIVEKIKELVKKGNISRIVITKNNETILNVPLNAGVVGLVIAPWAMIVATLVTMGIDCDIKLHTTDDKIINVNEEMGFKQKSNETPKEEPKTTEEGK